MPQPSTESYDLCGECGSVTLSTVWGSLNRDHASEDDAARVEAPRGEEPSFCVCPVCHCEHIDDDSDSGVWSGALVEMEATRATLLLDWPAHAEVWANTLSALAEVS